MTDLCPASGGHAEDTFTICLPFLSGFVFFDFLHFFLSSALQLLESSGVLRYELEVAHSTKRTQLFFFLGRDGSKTVQHLIKFRFTFIVCVSMD